MESETTQPNKKNKISKLVHTDPKHATQLGIKYAKSNKKSDAPIQIQHMKYAKNIGLALIKAKHYESAMLMAKYLGNMTMGPLKREVMIILGQALIQAGQIKLATQAARMISTLQDKNKALAAKTIAIELIKYGALEEARAIRQDLESQTSDYAKAAALELVISQDISPTPISIADITNKIKSDPAQRLDNPPHSPDPAPPNNPGLSRKQINTFKDIILSFFDENCEEITVKKRKQRGYNATLTKENITLRCFPDDEAESAKTYYYNLSKGLLLNKTDQMEAPDFIATFYQKIQEMCEDIKANTVEMEVR